MLSEVHRTVLMAHERLRNIFSSVGKFVDGSRDGVDVLHRREGDGDTG